MSMTVPEKHQQNIARKTMSMTCLGARILGGMNHHEAIKVLQRAGKPATRPKDCVCMSGTRNTESEAN